MRAFCVCALVVALGAFPAGCQLFGGGGEESGGGGGGGGDMWTPMLTAMVQGQLVIPQGAAAGMESGWKMGDNWVAHWGVVGQEGSNWCVECVCHMPGQTDVGIIQYVVAPDGRVQHAWIGKAGTTGTEAQVPAPPAAPPAAGGGQGGEAQVEVHDMGMESIQVGAGPINAHHIHTVVHSGGQTTESHMWYANDIMADFQGAYAQRNQAGQVVPGACVKMQTTGATIELAVHATNYRAQLQRPGAQP